MKSSRIYERLEVFSHGAFVCFFSTVEVSNLFAIDPSSLSTFSCPMDKDSQLYSMLSREYTYMILWMHIVFLQTVISILWILTGTKHKNTCTRRAHFLSHASSREVELCRADAWVELTPMNALKYSLRRCQLGVRVVHYHVDYAVL